MMTDAQRTDYLVSVLEGGNARAFAERAGMNQQAVTNLRKGRYRLDRYVTRILDAYPDVEERWLVTGEGEPLRSVRERGELLSRMASLEREVRMLTRAVEKLAECQKCQKSANDG